MVTFDSTLRFSEASHGAINDVYSYSAPIANANENVFKTKFNLNYVFWNYYILFLNTQLLGEDKEV